MATILSILSNEVIFYTLLFILALGVFTVYYFKVDVKGLSSRLVWTSIEKRMKKDLIRTNRREQAEKIGIKESYLKKVYRMTIQNIIASLGLHATVENFTTLFALIGLFSAVVFTMVFNNVVIGILLSIPVVSSFIAFLLSITKDNVRLHENRVMDALDILCPIIHNGVTNAIRQSVEVIDPKIRVHFIRFIDDMETRNIYFDQAIDNLNRALGPRFDDFAKKAKIFEFNERTGMAEMFMDIVETNSRTREINAKLDAMYPKFMTALIIALGMIGLFLAFALNSELTAEYMRTSFMGKLATSVSIGTMMIIYSLMKFIQVDIDFSSIKEKYAIKESKKLF